jgi:hypothetical protein
LQLAAKHCVGGVMVWSIDLGADTLDEQVSDPLFMQSESSPQNGGPSSTSYPSNEIVTPTEEERNKGVTGTPAISGNMIAGGSGIPAPPRNPFDPTFQFPWHNDSPVNPYGPEPIRGTDEEISKDLTQLAEDIATEIFDVDHA